MCTGQWQTQLSRQQVRALKQKQKEKQDKMAVAPVVKQQPEGGGPVVGKTGAAAGQKSGRGAVGRGGGGGKGEWGARKEGSGRVRRAKEWEKKRKSPDNGEHCWLCMHFMYRW